MSDSAAQAQHFDADSRLDDDGMERFSVDEKKCCDEKQVLDAKIVSGGGSSGNSEQASSVVNPRHLLTENSVAIDGDSSSRGRDCHPVVLRGMMVLCEAEGTTTFAIMDLF
mmetsp:Transcript_382/g.714  ORF Transcript_382/g.714 Transcript_382/m.714 type:complete len:111 (-) Transcript_382:134-466(-)|eukprot:CAMPEP_0170197186 /NCGR_PEP_ID=MMETSP0040_2-20121228/65764_1 /TAXON_ID=641309 /ORGANISM="Lotharella oceanica, Strain CCMP622" /LENGTH=110 /DNA_ID=CAMNT_0010446809 /DNA_START=158 /DNA_END=490 /DNA_ORIENTATION=-